jgi:hypothetical protein
MKIGLKLSACLTIWLLFAISCKKSGDEAVDCISEVINTPASMASTVNPSELTIIDNLFTQNSLSTSNQQFFTIDSIRFLDYGYPDSVTQTDILSYLGFNNLPVFFWNNNYIFYNGVLQTRSYVYTGPVPGPDTTFRQSLESLRHIYLNNFLKVGTSGGLVDGPIRYPDPSYRDSCLTAQPGYIDPSYFNSKLTLGNGFVKAWKITPVGSNYPMVMVEDSTGAAWPVSIYLP